VREHSLRAENTDGSETSEDQAWVEALSGYAGHAREERGEPDKQKAVFPGVVSTAKKVVRAVIAGAASRAGQGAVAAGTEATGLGNKGTTACPRQSSSCEDATSREEKRSRKERTVVHLRPGNFDHHVLFALVKEVQTGSKLWGFPFTRWVANKG
jgi:hypothetical protein